MSESNYSNQPSRVIFNNVTLTANFADNRRTFEVEGMEKLALDIQYAMGAAETANTIEFQLDHSADDGATWHSLVIDSTGTASVITPRVWQLTGTNNVNVIVDIAYRRMRMSLRETGVATNFGTATITYTLSGL